VKTRIAAIAQAAQRANKHPVVTMDRTARDWRQREGESAVYGDILVEDELAGTPDTLVTRICAKVGKEDDL
jgi:hypothetical protein